MGKVAENGDKWSKGMIRGQRGERLRRAQKGETNVTGEGKGGKRGETDGYFMGMGTERGDK
jgi:hypothetical protein